jgi:hypothetical protein
MLGYCYCFSPATITGTLSFTFREATALARSGISYCSGNARKVVDALCRAGEWLRLPGRCFVLDKAVWCIVREVDVDICRDGELLQVLVGEFSPNEVIRDRCHNRRLGGRQARGVGSFTLLAAVQVDPAFVGVPVRQGRRGQCPDPLGRTRRRHVVVRVPERVVQRCLGRRALGLHPLWLAVACGGGDERVRHELLRRGPVPSASPEAPGQEVLGLRGQPRRHLRQGVRVPDPVDGGEDVHHKAQMSAAGPCSSQRAISGAMNAGVPPIGLEDSMGCAQSKSVSLALLGTELSLSLRGSMILEVGEIFYLFLTLYHNVMPSKELGIYTYRLLASQEYATC